MLGTLLAVPSAGRSRKCGVQAVALWAGRRCASWRTETTTTSQAQNRPNIQDHTRRCLCSAPYPAQIHTSTTRRHRRFRRCLFKTCEGPTKFVLVLSSSRLRYGAFPQRRLWRALCHVRLGLGESHFQCTQDDLSKLQYFIVMFVSFCLFLYPTRRDGRRESRVIATACRTLSPPQSGRLFASCQFPQFRGSCEHRWRVFDKVALVASDKCVQQSGRHAWFQLPKTSHTWTHHRDPVQKSMECSTRCMLQHPASRQTNGMSVRSPVMMASSAPAQILQAHNHRVHRAGRHSEPSPSCKVQHIVVRHKFCERITYSSSVTNRLWKCSWSIGSGCAFPEKSLVAVAVSTMPLARPVTDMRTSCLWSYTWQNACAMICSCPGAVVSARGCTRC